MAPAAQGQDRTEWLAARRRDEVQRFDREFADTYDEHWGEVYPTHARMVERFLSLCPSGGEILDAACGTGKYWPMVLAAGRRLHGIDQSAGMLRRAAAKHPEVPTRLGALTDIDERATCDGVMCMDAMEYVPPEEWPAVLAAFRRALRPGGRLYLTVEQIDPAEREAEYRRAAGAGHPVVPGESVTDSDPGGDVGYHYYPAREQVLEWLGGAGFELLEETLGDDYLHLIART